MKKKEYENAVEAYKQALRNNPNDEETRYNLALAKELLKKQQDEQQNNQDQNQDQGIEQDHFQTAEQENQKWSIQSQGKQIYKQRNLGTEVYSFSSSFSGYNHLR